MSNQDQIDYWNGNAGATWVSSQDYMDAMLAPLTAPLIQAASVKERESCIDVGCGCGDTSLQMAQTGASVWGVDVSEPMLARATQRATELGLGNATFSAADAAATTFSAEHDLVFSRFGVMFFTDPVGAFKNLHSSLNDGGRLCFLCWQPPGKNPWMSTAGKAIKPFMTEPETPPDPRAPGPFAFADADYLNGVLQKAGFNNIDISPVTATMHIADNLDDAVEFQQRIGPLARALAELEGEQQEQALAAARAELSSHMTDDGLNLGAACWLAQATAR